MTRSLSCVLAGMLLFGCSPAEAVQGTQEDILQQPERFERATIAPPDVLQQPERFDQAPELKGPPVSWEQAEQMVGQWAAVEGTIVRTHNSGRACFLNFAEDWKGRFHLVVFARSFEEYSASPEKLFLNQRVRITGKISEYKGASQIILEDPSQIVFLDGEPVIEEERKRSIPALPMLAMSPSHGWTLVSWNIENFFDVWDDPWARDEVTQPAFVREKRKEGIAQVLRALDADVIALQEVENRGLLQEFVEDYLAGEGFELVLIEGNDTRGIDVALLSKIPIKKVSSHRNVPLVKADGSPTHFQRDLLEVRLDRPRNPSVYVVHLKSQHGDEVADEIRDAEVRGILSILGEEMEGRKKNLQAVVVGDFNEVPDHPIMRQLFEAEQGASSLLFDPMAGSEKYTYNKEPYLTRIDYALCTQSMRGEIVSANIVDLSPVPGLKLESLSDHYPLRLVFAAPSITDIPR